jgi:hypothetical protein
MLKQRGLVITATALLLFLTFIWINLGCVHSLNLVKFCKLTVML